MGRSKEARAQQLAGPATGGCDDAPVQGRIAFRSVKSTGAAAAKAKGRTASAFAPAPAQGGGAARAGRKEDERSRSPELGSPSPPDDADDGRGDGLSAYERARLKRIADNQLTLQQLGITQLAQKAGALGAAKSQARNKRRCVPVLHLARAGACLSALGASLPASGRGRGMRVQRRRRLCKHARADKLAGAGARHNGFGVYCRIDSSDDDDGDWAPSDDDEAGDDDDVQQQRMTRAPKKPRRKPTAWKSLREPDRCAVPTARSRSDASGRGAAARSRMGPEVVGRRLRVSVMTEDTGKNEWHYGELSAHRMRKGKGQHLIRWDTVGEKDEWIVLEEEEYYMYQLGEREHVDEEGAEDPAEASTAEVRVLSRN